ncbi:hypothetical protein [Azospirillum sp.]|uniref:hypothetical protein n=1 Tax=Azospirillum sp. TaxID=34012 RepID=UPI002D5461EE|nr:hypothetical protein [Azospirillum sp.]HYD66084.1 hypothetical protein [Azospirillum sp.]
MDENPYANLAKAVADKRREELNAERIRNEAALHDAEEARREAINIVDSIFDNIIVPEMKKACEAFSKAGVDAQVKCERGVVASSQIPSASLKLQVRQREMEGPSISFDATPDLAKVIIQIRMASRSIHAAFSPFATASDDSYRNAVVPVEQVSLQSVGALLREFIQNTLPKVLR